VDESDRGKFHPECLIMTTSAVDNKFSRVQQVVITRYNSSGFVLYKRVTSLLKTTINIRKGGMMRVQQSSTGCYNML